MTRILVLYASTHGHTGKIAARIAETIGPAAELRDIAAGATDTSRDHDFTDWDAVERFAEECAGLAVVTSS